MTDNIIKIYVAKSTGNFESIKDKVNTCLSQFNVIIETESPREHNLRY